MAVKQLDTDHTLVRFEAGYPAIEPAALFAYWVQPELLARWWPPQAAVDARLDGEYTLSWPQMGWYLRGRYTAFQPGVKLAFTWKWDHEPDLPERQVSALFSPLDGATILTLEHGTYTDSEIDQKDRQSHIDGWTHFLAQLQACV